jgi:5-methylcytosine-specific restriction enzyme subunit McrC
MQTIQLFEHQRKSYNDLGLEPDDPMLVELEKLNERTGTDIISIGRKHLTATQYVGILKVGKRTIQILPKIDYQDSGISPFPTVDNESQQIRTASVNLLHLLSYTHDLPMKSIEQTSISSQTGEWFELLTHLYATELHNLMGGGLPRAYLSREEELPLLRGRWQLEKQLRRHPHVQHRFDVIYDEFLPDIPMNRIFRFVSERLLWLSTDRNNRTLLGDHLTWLQEVTCPNSVTKAELDQIIFTRLNDHFKPAFNLARLFLDLGIFEFRSMDQQAYAFVFDMNRLFEAFIASFLTRHRQLILPPHWKDVQILSQGKRLSQYLAIRENTQTPVFHLKPDLVFLQMGQNPLLILDTKYKQLDPTKRVAGISEGDMYQMFAYASRFNCSRALLLYPRRSGGAQMWESYKVPDSDTTIYVADINLHWPISDYLTITGELNNLFSRVIQRRTINDGALS